VSRTILFRNSLFENVLTQRHSGAELVTNKKTLLKLPRLCIAAPPCGNPPQPYAAVVVFRNRLSKNSGIYNIRVRITHIRVNALKPS